MGLQENMQRFSFQQCTGAAQGRPNSTERGDRGKHPGVAGGLLPWRTVSGAYNKQPFPRAATVHSGHHRDARGRCPETPV